MAMGTDDEGVLAGVSLDRAGEVPIGVQLAWALRARIGDSRLAPGQRLPGLRELAEALGINANTVRAVYQRLEREGLIESRQGTGTFVAGDSGASAAAGLIAADAAQQARQTGVDPREVAAALYVSADPATRTSTEAEARRRELRAQIAALEQTLSETHMRYPGVIQAPAEPDRRAGPRLLGVEDLEDVRSELVRRLAEAEPLLQAARLEERQSAEARRGEIARTAAANERARTSSERKSAERQASKRSEQKPHGEKPPAGARATRRPGPSTA